MAIYTGRGDGGETSLGDGTRVPKTSVRVEAYGTVDEASSALGLARAAAADELLDDVLAFMQQRFFNCSSNLATPGGGAAPVSADDVAFLERATDAFLDSAGGMSGFVLPAGGETSSRLHVARTVVRRAERRVDALAAIEPVDAELLRFLNRASDTLFAAARYAAALDGVTDEPWDAECAPPLLP